VKFEIKLPQLAWGDDGSSKIQVSIFFKNIFRLKLFIFHMLQVLQIQYQLRVPEIIGTNCRPIKYFQPITFYSR